MKRWLTIFLSLVISGGVAFADGPISFPTGGGSGSTNASDLSSGTVAAARGGTNLNTSASTGHPYVLSGTWSIKTLSQILTLLGLSSTDNVAFGTVTADEFISSAADNTRGVAVPNTADPTTTNLAAGKCWWNITSNDWRCRNGDNTVTVIVGAQIKTFSFAIDNVVAATDNVLLTRVPRAWTITRADCYASTDNVIGNLMECSTSDVTSCTVLDAWTVTNAADPFTDSSMTDGAVAAGAWLRWSTTSVGTTNSNKFSCTIQYRE